MPAPSGALSPDMLVDDVMRAHPATIRIFMSHHMQCIGCPIGRIHTIAEACREHGIPLDALMAELEARIGRARR